MHNNYKFHILLTDKSTFILLSILQMLKLPKKKKPSYSYSYLNV